MASSHQNWDDLSSRNERLVPLPKPRACAAQTGASEPAAPAADGPRWAALSSQGERLADSSDLPPRAAVTPRPTGLRLAATATTAG